VKLPLLLTQYLREHRLLRLPGLGSFHSSATQPGAEAETSSNLYIRFEHVSVKEADDSLITFIKEKTGKIKPLALADLASYIESGLQMLNIGKPFYIEGIGTIHKNRDGAYDFVARELAINRGDEPGKANADYNEKKHDKKKSVFDDEKYSPSVNPWQKIIVAALIIGGLAVVVLGGYYLYNQNNGEPRIQNTIVPAVDSTQQQKDSLNRADSARTMATFASLNPGAYKFIIETTTNKKRAMRRYKQLIDFTNVKIESPDSASYKLYFVISAGTNDTTRIKDSLSRFYASKVKIEF
jgi:hypothetical protein